ncbi:MAG: hypothetical protein ABSC94_01565 [Polyangiaceae bacterium]|jgi:hypothetical protein
MSNAQINLEDDSTDQLETVESSDVNDVTEDHLIMTRLPPLPRPPPLGRTAAARPASVVENGGRVSRAMFRLGGPLPVAAVSVVGSLLAIAIAVFIGLRDVPSELLETPAVAAAVVVARAVVAVGLITFSLVLLGIGERLFLEGSLRRIERP